MYMQLVVPFFLFLSTKNIAKSNVHPRLWHDEVQEPHQLYHVCTVTVL